MKRNHYMIFSVGRIGSMVLPNRLVRSATWDPSILGKRKMNDEVLGLYRKVAAGGVGLIITGDFSVVPRGMLDVYVSGQRKCSYEDVRIDGFGLLADEVHRSAPNCRIVAQISGEYQGVAPSDVPSPFTTERFAVLSTEQIKIIIRCFIESVAGVKEDGFDGVQFHAAHGGLLSQFLSPYTNRRRDEYGGSVKNRVRIISEIVSGAREKVGDFPILIKLNCTDYVDGGIDIDNFPLLAEEMQNAGVDAIELSGGMMDCLIKSESELGFRPVPKPESHTYLKNPEKQSYFLKYAEHLALEIPVILVGGNRDIERLEEIIQKGKADFIALCRPLISEPDLPDRWLEGRGNSGTDCISCNSCIWDMNVRCRKGEPALATCVYKQDIKQTRIAQRWLSSWVEKHITP